MQLTSKAEIDQLHVMSIFTKLFSKDLNRQGIEWSSTQWTKGRRGCYHSLCSTPSRLLDQPTCSSRGSPKLITDQIKSL